jgi:broad specificity phosphatase PhoE
MREIWLIRHAQASFGAANYDKLSDLGHRQADWTGAHIRDLDPPVERIVTGGLVRQIETATEIAAALNAPPAPEVHPGFAEYNAEAVLRAFLADRPHPPAEDRRAHFRALSAGIAAWQTGEIDGAESWAAFTARVANAMRAAEPEQGVTLVVSSGGVIAQAVNAVLQAPGATMVRLHMQMKNAGMTRLIVGGTGLFLNTFNQSPHLEGPARPGALTYS